MRRVVFNQKGGVGKSSIAANLAALSAANGYKTLLIDLDVQGNSSHYLGYDINSDSNTTVADLLNQTVGWFSVSTPVKDFPQPTPFSNLDIIPSSPKLEKIESELERRYKIYKLRDALDELEKSYDRIYIDTPPNLNFFSKAALIAAKRLLIPFDCDSFSQQALITLLNNVAELREDHNPKLEVEGVIVNMFNAQANFPAQIIADLSDLGLPILEPYLPLSIKMKESHYHQQPLIHLLPNHKLTITFEELFHTLEETADKTAEIEQ
ncbi:cobalamin biosynthesis protein CobQ [Photobacterium proteolyticum]|uniref:Cobalamin biosynthesis protein CobQ n=1 Tax=Photobacterium proteolyticum TaxID=1903952 RepID=A0A1Q9GSQ2_9GAMM|nr:ParA family protein [Photobacterium proteolyticum]OLQ77733.1 cobalamin biosynthesis protein CobQ [Photobacterium proteolyticum]